MADRFKSLSLIALLLPCCVCTAVSLCLPIAGVVRQLGTPYHSSVGVATLLHVCPAALPLLYLWCLANACVQCLIASCFSCNRLHVNVAADRSAAFLGLARTMLVQCLLPLLGQCCQQS
jgi:hypothetical protein